MLCAAARGTLGLVGRALMVETLRVLAKSSGVWSAEAVNSLGSSKAKEITSGEAQE